MSLFAMPLLLISICAQVHQDNSAPYEWPPLAEKDFGFDFTLSNDYGINPDDLANPTHVCGWFCEEDSGVTIDTSMPRLDFEFPMSDQLEIDPFEEKEPQPHPNFSFMLARKSSF